MILYFRFKCVSFTAIPRSVRRPAKPLHRRHRVSFSHLDSKKREAVDFCADSQGWVVVSVTAISIILMVPMVPLRLTLLRTEERG